MPEFFLQNPNLIRLQATCKRHRRYDFFEFQASKQLASNFVHCPARLNGQAVQALWSTVTAVETSCALTA